MILLTEYDAKYAIGGKARNLFKLQELNFRVPRFVVIPAEETIGGTRLSLDEGSFGIIQKTFPQTQYFSVRSSAVDEDGIEHSFAGQFETFLFVTLDDLEEKINQVCQSAQSDRVKKYRQEKGLESHQGMAVIIQEMIDSDVAGVGFGINPVSGNRSEKVINAVFGLGEGLVSGELNADHYSIIHSKIESTIVQKDQALKHGSNGGTKLVKVDSENQLKPSLTDAQALELESVLQSLYQFFGHYQDIEFAIFKDQLYLLQTRPITTVSTLPDISSEYIIWDNSNIIESYPGVSSPMTFSFINPVYEAVYRQFAAMMGVKEREIEANKFVFENMLGYLNGRVYYNLLSWYKALALLPGYSLNAEFMEKMMGVKQRFQLKNVKTYTKAQEYLRILRLGAILIKNMVLLPKMKRKFVKEFNQTLLKFNGIDFHSLQSFEIMQLFSEFETTLLKKWKAPLVNDFFAMIYFGVLQKLVVKYQLPENSTIHNDLIATSNDIISTQPIIECLKLSELILNDGSLKSLFTENPAEEIWRKLNLENNAILEKINSYIAVYGNRCVGELKLETITYQEDPISFISVIKSYVKQGADSANFHTDEQNIRLKAEQKVKEFLRKKWMKRIVFHFFLKRARQTVSDRENLRFERTKAFGMIRRMVKALGLKLAAENCIEDPRDIYFLTKQELFDFIKGTSVQANLKELIALRKIDQLSFENEQLAERIESYGIVNSGNSFERKDQNEEFTGDFSGVPCCAGIVKAKVQVIHHPSEAESLNGDILVTSSTDPGWVLLFPTASGILVERGSLLSHSAIVSREMGKPCIVGINNLLQHLKTGDWVEMNGSTGEIRKLNDHE